MRSLKDLLVNDYGLDLAGWTLTSATAISADGRTIAGYGNNPAGYTEAFLVTIPEPASLTLFALLALPLARRRIRKTPWHRPHLLKKSE